MEKAKPKRSHKIAIPIFVVIAALGAVLGGLTGVAVTFGLGMLAFIVTLAAASFASWRDRKRETESDSHGAAQEH
ncbi:hypothetical protein [Pelagicoccus sp. SDUM812002]|uniref:hypothetical protein n=1 Tax=Pelagicoccus sp. SDUM812002 TaxID=3041266 RepID=UPI00280C8760|nr:hypothetical protein [Pelagicoccus sp. SDUM812002]MDQ8188433.1 hypothetical protein [Pelagicoccus sp. SDUM812002]